MVNIHPPTLLLGTVLAVSCGLLPAAEVRATTPTHACHSDQYNVVELPLLPTVITPSGVVAGTTEAHRAAVWRRGSGLQELSVPEGFHFTEAVAIKKSGAVVVNALDAQGRKRRSFVYSERSVIALVGNQTLAHGMSVSGVIVGEWVPEGTTRSDAAYWSNNLPHSIGLCCGGTLKAANKAGEMIGDAYDEQGRYHAFAWSSSRGERRIGPPDRYSSAVAINDAGHILIQVAREAYLDEEGTLQHLDLSQEFHNSVLAMNNCDSVVGGYGPDSDHYRAFSWTATAGFQDLNSLVPADSGWALGSATAINDRGEIVGQGVFHGDERGFLLSPRARALH
jgi:uncharacterized membrane protein